MRSEAGFEIPARAECGDPNREASNGQIAAERVILSNPAEQAGIVKHVDFAHEWGRWPCSESTVSA